jgi:phage-related holin
MVGGTFFYIGNELFSLVENYGRLQLPLPEQVKKVIAVLQAKGESKEDSK